MESVYTIITFVANAFLDVWPYLLLTIPLAVAVKLSGVAHYIHRAFAAQPVAAIVLATVVGAFSPLCACGVIPVVASLLIGGVPLGPVMAFWIASPSMDPETFFLSVAMLGWPLAVARLTATLVLSLSAGFLTQLLAQRGWLGEQLLRAGHKTEVRSMWAWLHAGWRWLGRRLRPLPVPIWQAALAGANTVLLTVEVDEVSDASGCGSGGGATCAIRTPSRQQRVLRETWAATWLVLRFMVLAFFLEALITLYVPEAWIVGRLGRQNPAAVALAAFLGVPMYTSNLTALPLIGGLLAQGMNPAAALAFLVAGPTTTLPAMAAVWGLVTRRVFALYMLFVLVGAMVAGYVYYFAVVVR